MPTRGANFSRRCAGLVETFAEVSDGKTASHVLGVLAHVSITRSQHLAWPFRSHQDPLIGLEDPLVERPRGAIWMHAWNTSRWGEEG